MVLFNTKPSLLHLILFLNQDAVPTIVQQHNMSFNFTIFLRAIPAFLWIRLHLHILYNHRREHAGYMASGAGKVLFFSSRLNLTHLQMLFRSRFFLFWILFRPNDGPDDHKEEAAGSDKENTPPRSLLEDTFHCQSGFHILFLMALMFRPRSRRLRFGREGGQKSNTPSPTGDAILCQQFFRLSFRQISYCLIFFQFFFRVLQSFVRVWKLWTWGK